MHQPTNQACTPSPADTGRVRARAAAPGGVIDQFSQRCSIAAQPCRCALAARHVPKPRHLLAQAMILIAQTPSGDGAPLLSRAGLLFGCWTQRRTMVLARPQSRLLCGSQTSPPPPLRWPRAQGEYCGLRARYWTCWSTSEPVSDAGDQQNGSCSGRRRLVDKTQ